MIDEIDRQLSDWIGTVLKKVDVSLGLPGAAVGVDRSVGLYLLELTHVPVPRGKRRPPIQVRLRYLVTTRAPEPQEEHQMLGQLLIAALKDPEFEVEQESLPISTWEALNVEPRPSFVLRVPFTYEQPERLAPLVRRPLVIKTAQLRSLSGQVFGPEDIPIVDARVEVPGLQLYTNTDSKGRFHFSSVPAEPYPKLLHVRAKGKEFFINTEQANSGTEPLVIHLQLEG
jgi:hypothetical protein